jgi:hypothetical protein
VTWVTFEAAAGGLVVVQLRHIVAIYDELGVVKLATASGGEHVLKDVTVQQAAAIVTAAAEADPVVPVYGLPARPPIPLTPGFQALCVKPPQPCHTDEWQIQTIGLSNAKTIASPSKSSGPARCRKRRPDSPPRRKPRAGSPRISACGLQRIRSAHRPHGGGAGSEGPAPQASAPIVSSPYSAAPSKAA